jgi:hypothetical protein
MERDRTKLLHPVTTQHHIMPWQIENSKWMEKLVVTNGKWASRDK